MKSYSTEPLSTWKDLARIYDQAKKVDIERQEHDLLRLAAGSIDATSEEKLRRGVLRLKRTALGFCGRETIVSSDRLAKILLNAGLVDSVQRGISYLESGHFANISIQYTDTTKKNLPFFLEIRKDPNSDHGGAKYAISKQERRPIHYHHVLG